MVEFLEGIGCGFSLGLLLWAFSDDINAAWA